MKERLLVVLGPTAVGKTDLAVELALRHDGEVVSGDSMLVYRGMDIGTAKPSQEERRGIPHHLIDILEPNEPYDAVRFGEQAEAVIKDIQARGRLPVLAGGTGLYVQAFLEGYVFSEVAEDAPFREEMEALAQKEGNEAVHRLLQKADPLSAAKLHPNNLRRVIRALEVARQGGETLSLGKKAGLASSWLEQSLVVGLTMERSALYRRIDQRVERMAAAGLETEVKSLLAAQVETTCQSMQGIGYKEMVAHLQGQYSFEETVAIIQKNTRHFAKRQFTWFKRMPYVQWFDVGQDGWRDDVFSLVRHWEKTGSSCT
ncbi:tRNA (adenosine(37)-N6)-dimethylallyltransferase MiaA [Anaeroarcus burkinensis]|uniref:tRNA (adenosine(37)-N6)-dimethylallyltransferase MiaA n=1 Tax=Anaeroarcus burkinensis TaxID=82376 RepID=UPI0004051759|nr:tRNA (adenosine(37)-N6)-dimethylallyltransferase MiaA [Anaeroarcus burkinensis]